MSQLKITRFLSASRGRRWATALLATVSALLLLLAVACGGGGGGSGLEDMLRMLPDDADGAFYIDVAALFDDDDLRPVRRDLEDEWEGTDFEDDFDIEVDDVSYVVFGEDGGNDFFLLGGLEDLDDLRDELDDLDYDDDEIRDTEVWINTSESWEAVAFLDGDRVLIAQYESDMEDVLRRLDRDSSSLYDEVEDIVSDLPGGFIHVVTDCGSDCLSAATLQKDGSDVTKLIQTALYEDEDDAEDAEDDFKDDIEDDDLPRGCSDADADRSGNAVTFEIVCDSDFFNFYVRFDL